MGFIGGAILFGIGIVLLIVLGSEILWDTKKRRDEKEQDVRNY